MCGRVFIKTNLEGLMQAFAWAGREGALGLDNQFPRYNGAPSLNYPIIIMEPDLGPIFASANWGFVPRFSKDGKGDGKRPPVNARREGIATNGMFKAAYRWRRCLVPIDGYFEWKDIYGNGKNKQPYAIALKTGEPFALAGIWETWRNPETREEIRTFCIITCEPNELMAQIHDRMPVLLHPDDYRRWMSDEPDPDDLMKPYPTELMRMWPIGRDVGSPKNDRPDILDEVEPEPTTPTPEDPEPSLF